MKRACFVALAALALAAAAAASPNINSAVINLRIYNDDSDSTLTFGDNYATSLWIQDAVLDGDGEGGEWANRHNFRLSENDLTAAVFNNADGFVFFADVMITGPAASEGGLNVAPWWSKDVDGTFMLRPSDGEVACFGGRLPFYNFTADQGVTYTLGTTVRLGVVYNPNSLTMEDPGTIQYFYTDADRATYSSPVLPFDEGNPGEGYGTWGILDDARVGGYFQPLIDVGNPDNWGRIDFGNMYYVPEPASLLLLGLLAVLRRR